MKFILFKEGDYGSKGKWTGDVFKNLIKTKELDIIPFHSSEFLSKGILKSEIPVIGKFRDIIIDEDKIVANDIEIFDKNNFKNRKVDRLSVEIENGTITRVGALPEGVNPAVVESSSLKGLEFNENVEMDWLKQKNIINFNGGDKMNLEEILTASGKISLEEKIKVVNTIFKSFEDHEIDVAKKGINLEIFEEKQKTKTEEEIKEEVKKEFQKEQEIKEFMEKNKNKITPAMKSLGISTLIEKILKDNDGIIEFAENGASKKSNSKEILNKIFEGMKSYNEAGMEFSEFDGKNETIAQKAVREYKERNGVK